MEREREYPMRNFLIKVILFVIFIILLLWLLPMPKINLRGESNKIFNSNLNSMKEVGKEYFTRDKLPEKVGDKKKLTLKEMLDQKLLLPVTDSEGKECDINKSYVEITKKEKDYQFKINLKCGKQEDYIISNVGCYNYCPNSVCEKEVIIVNKECKNNCSKAPIKKPTTIINTVITGPLCELYVTSGEKGENEWHLSDVNVAFKYRSTTQRGAEVREYGISTDPTPTYNGKSNYKVRGEGQTKVYGYVKDSNNKTAICSILVKKDTVAPSCDIAITKANVDNNGLYNGNVTASFTSKLDQTSGVKAFGMNSSSQVLFNSKREFTVSGSGRHNIYGFVKDYAGNVKQCSVGFEIKQNDNNTSTPSCELAIQSGVKGDNDWYVSPVKVIFKNKNSTNGATITRYGLGKDEVYNNYNYINAIKDGYYLVRGFVQDSNGNKAICSIRFKKDATKPECSLGVESGTYKDGYYTSNVTIGFNNKSDNLSGLRAFGIGKSENYNNGLSYYLTNDGKHTIYGYVKDNAGNKNICSINVEKKKIGYEYQYMKHFEETYSNWSNWEEKTYNPSNPPKFEKTKFHESVDLGKQTITKYRYKNTSPIEVYDLEEFATVYETTCDGYKYYRPKTTTTKVIKETIRETSSTITYRTVATTNYYIVNTKTTTTTTYPGSGSKTFTTPGNWEYKGLVSTSTGITNTLSNRYDFVGMDWSRCGNDCTSTPYTVWKHYQRGSSTTTVAGQPATSSTSVGTSSKKVITDTTYRKDSYGNVTGDVVSSNTREEVSVTYGPVTAVCTNVVRKPTTLYVYVGNIVGWKQEKIPYQETVYRFKERFRNILSKAYDDYKWSFYNDLVLINQGYRMTGNTRIVG